MKQSVEDASPYWKYKEKIYMNILFVTDYAAPYAGNFIHSIERLSEKLNDAQHDVYFAFPETSRKLDWLKDLGKRYPVSFKLNLRDLLSEIRDNHIDLVYTHFCLPRTQCYAKAAARLLKVPLVQHWHNHYQKGRGIKGAIFSWAFRGDMNIGCSKSVMDSLPYPTRIKTYVDNAIDFSRLDQYDHSFSFESNPRATIVLMFGFDLYRKGVDLVLDAIAQIAQQNDRSISLVISLSKNHEIIKTYIIRKFGCQPDWVHVIDARDDVATYYHAAGIFVSAAREEGFCYSLIEAAYCGCNVISSEIDGVPYQTIPFCKTFPSESVDLLRKAILESMVSNSPEQRKETAETVVRKFDLDVWAEREVNILENVAGISPTPFGNSR